MAVARSVKQEARDALWRKGVLVFKLHKQQKQLYELYYSSPAKVQVWLIARRFGKTTALCVLALEQCIRQPNSIVKFLSPTKIQVNNNVRPLFKLLLEDCPEDIKPHFSQKDYIYYFPNGSEIQLAGSESGHAEKLRGGSSHIAFVDEAGDCSNLKDTVNSILLPTTLTTDGKIILSGTPPKDPDHDFIDFIETAEGRGTLIKKTIHDNPLLTEKQITDLFEELGGSQSESSQRELFCEIIRDPSTSVLPEFTKDLEKEIVGEWKRPAHFDMYEAMDLGFKDLTVIIIGYFDFRNNKVVIDDEVVVDFKTPDTTLTTLVSKLQRAEELRYFNYLTNEQKKPSKRVSDIDYIVMNEIKKLSNYEINFEAVKKDNLDAMVNFLREKLKKKEISINPRCTTLIRHLRNVKWKKGEKAMFARSPDDGHYDAVAALTYFIRSIDYRKNPYPAHFGLTEDQRDLFGNYILGKSAAATPNMDTYRKIFNIKKK